MISLADKVRVYQSVKSVLELEKLVGEGLITPRLREGILANPVVYFPNELNLISPIEIEVDGGSEKYKILAEAQVK